jgi:ABC-2 type transport system ATP-binding protein
MDEAERLCDRIAIMDHGRIIARGTPRELIASLGVEHLVEIALDGQRGVSIEELKAVPGVREVRNDAGRYQLAVSELHESVPLLFGTLARRGLAPTELRTHSATLEDVFVHLTGRHLRDE